MITVEGLTKNYGGFRAVDGVSFAAQPGAVTGFLGPNGSGKSTTMRILTGLTAPTAGTALIGGVNYRDIPNPASQVGVLLDASAQHPGRTGREVLIMAAIAMGLPRTRVEEVLELVSLTPTEAKRRIGNYSLGMKQRLGIAHALMGDPRVLILDEPANGLDPAGIHWMRGLLRDYANRGGTVLLSSHLLHEVEVIADELVVIGRGQVVASGTVGELLATSGTYVRAEDLTALADQLTAAGISSETSADGGLVASAEPAQVGRALASSGVALTELRPAEGRGLEAMFLELTSETQREGAGQITQRAGAANTEGNAA